MLEKYDPPLVWKLFESISGIPRCSKHEQRIRSWIRRWAGKRALPSREDEAGNLLLQRAAAPGCEKFPTLVLQAHLDMVCLAQEKHRVDFDTHPIRIRVDGKRVRAEGTTLGADNGIGVAYCLAALEDPELVCGPLEVLLTVDEEEGAAGALGLKPGFFSGRYLLNLDSEEEGIITIGTAGIETTDYTLAASFEPVDGAAEIGLSIRGLPGGHSGVEIHLGRPNAIKLAVEALAALGERLPVRLARFDGGEATNSIPAAVECLFSVPRERADQARSVLRQWQSALLQSSCTWETQPEIEISDGAARGAEAGAACTVELTRTLGGLLEQIPHGPLAYSRVIEHLVETSNNLARIRTGEGGFEISATCRSSVDESLERLSGELKRIGEANGAQVRQHSRLCGWSADPASRFSELVRMHYGAVLGRPVALKAIHAGLECGIFTGIAPGLQMASIGPDITAVHTPEESVDLASVALLWKVLRRIITGMGEMA